jgi:hypothetical protein
VNEQLRKDLDGILRYALARTVVDDPEYRMILRVAKQLDAAVDALDAHPATPDPELWGRVIALCYDEFGHQIYQLCVEPPSNVDLWWLSVGELEQAAEYEGFGSTWNDAARVLIAEWEGRK